MTKFVFILGTLTMLTTSGTFLRTVRVCHDKIQLMQDVYKYAKKSDYFLRLMSTSGLPRLFVSRAVVRVAVAWCITLAKDLIESSHRYDA
jgi:hypothetical protein